jgi:hypothetical protein
MDQSLSGLLLHRLESCQQEAAVVRCSGGALQLVADDALLARELSRPAASHAVDLAAREAEGALVCCLVMGKLWGVHLVYQLAMCCMDYKLGAKLAKQEAQQLEHATNTVVAMLEDYMRCPGLLPLLEASVRKEVEAGSKLLAGLLTEEGGRARLLPRHAFHMLPADELLAVSRLMTGCCSVTRRGRTGVWRAWLCCQQPGAVAAWWPWQPVQAAAARAAPSQQRAGPARSTQQAPAANPPGPRPWLRPRHRPAGVRLQERAAAVRHAQDGAGLRVRADQLYAALPGAPPP